MQKYALLREWIAENPAIDLAVPAAASTEALTRIHDPGYVGRVERGELTRDEVRRIGFPWTPQLVERSKRSVGGTIAAAFSALDDGAAANLAGGTHHAFADRGEGFCVFNDVAVAARALQAEGRITRCGVIDLDVHQGNGTAAVFAGDDTVYTASVHGEANYPFRKEISDLDLPLPDGATDDRFLDAVETATRRTFATSPDFVFYIAGADAFEGDKLGRLSVTKAGMRARDEIVFDACLAEGTPFAVVMSGGYALDVHDTVEIHAATVLGAARQPVR